MTFEKKISPSVIDETLYNEKEASVTVKPELEVSSVLCYFEEQRDPTGRFKKKSKEDYRLLMKVYWPYYLIPLGEDMAIGIDGMALDPYEVYSDLTISDADVKAELTKLDDESLFQGLMNLQNKYQKLGKMSSIAGLLKANVVKALIDLSYCSGSDSFMGINLNLMIKEGRAEEIYKTVKDYIQKIEELKNNMDKKNQTIAEVIKTKINTVLDEIKKLEEDYDKKISDLTPILEQNKTTINQNRQAEIDHLKKERENEITQTMNLIKESFKPIESKVKLVNDLWEKDKNTVLGINDPNALVSETHSSIDKFKARLSEFDDELSSIKQEISKISERFNQVNQKYDGEERIVNDKFDKQVKEEDDKMTALEVEKKSKIDARKFVQDRLDKEQNRVIHLTNAFKSKLDESNADLNAMIAKDVELAKSLILMVPIWYIILANIKSGMRSVSMPPVFLPRLLPKKINDDGLGQSEVAIKIFSQLFIEEIRDKFRTFLSSDNKAKKQLEELIGDQDYFKVKQIRNHFIDGIEMLLGRQLVSVKNKEIIQSNLLSTFKFSE